MKSHSAEILEKMKDKKYPELNFDMAFKLTNESERGAILIGVNKVEEYLEKLIESLLPSKKKSYQAKLLNYPGPLSTFAGKIELLYAFHIIDNKVYNSLTCLRKISNQAAHSSDLFSLQNIKEQLEEIYDFEDRMNDAIHELSFNNLLSFKKDQVVKLLQEKGMEENKIEKVWNERVGNPETNQAIIEQLTIWKLAYGLTFLCLKIEVIEDEYKSMNLINDTWLDKL